MYKFVGKKGVLYQICLEPINIKLNYRCKEGTVEEGSFSCGNNPQEAKKNYEEQQKEKLPSDKSSVLHEKPTTKNKLSAKEKDIISEYTRFKYAPINQYLFGKQLNFSPKQEAEIKQNINDLSNIINNNKIDEDTKVYRGLAGQSKEDFLKMIKKVKPGNSISYKGFMSTSPDKSIGERFAT
ncbi:MAG: ADP-ribosyltransferase exoenzyme [Candidatus Methanofastidiosum methylothiophilum]|uniref:ADP-ribosyltransferase exoenzyme n=1 Tax=Candidatus Methanofastidiosum methylothiophilum TaxID=1705564 RepID=A0A150JEJ8_9EURY|nr:MAG: ADP-ribosyltransferase exoenzyme [Candidatus Methanofastidiosum methylthiophilus]KYC55617.1 MAG: ADP-ribosyltransferase exoenzyme [Candidatus Methanofastidiosum methylthiophilus]